MFANRSIRCPMVGANSFERINEVLTLILIPSDILEEAKKGVFPNEKNFKCYVSCLLDMMQATKRGKISYEKSLKQIDTLLPDDFKPDFRNGLEACKDVAQGVKDHCESAYVLLNCFYQNNPKFIFP
ncbi:general odorant-binding protein 19a [Culex quinquefasciatus]|uniref:General odorant-binding protein 19a n=1 Tax=Culex quinquefasciatus TaxID=7176 RepID=B0XC65_CULQU|nr:general odorant-binding protein 19a [Culex quinquefasciatus]|eukprot:XP_001867237.1 general odorant-binding protein 19a [Culex quinquefasciatus]